MNIPVPERPPLSTELSGAEFARWYWLKDELSSFARTLGLKTTGSKDLLTARITASLNGLAFAEPAIAPKRSATQLSGQLHSTTLIPAGQRSSQVLRAWFTERIGPSFHFDVHMREFIATSNGTRTFGHAIEHWHATRNLGPTEIDSQFEYNRFTRVWHQTHPEGSKEQLLNAWNSYRNRPIDERGRV